MRWSAHISDAADPKVALDRACHAAHEVHGDDPVHLVLLFVSARHIDAAEVLSELVCERFPGAVLFGGSAGGVIGVGTDLESGPGLTLVAAHLPDVALRTFHLHSGSDAPEAGSPPAAWHDWLGVTPDHLPGFLLLTDPYSVDAGSLVEVLDDAFPGCPKVGGIGSGALRRGHGVLFCGGRVVHEGAVGLALWGDIELHPVVAQGVRPVGPALQVTEARRNLAVSLDDGPAIQAFTRMFARLTEADRHRLRRGPVVGVAEGDPLDPSRAPGPHDWLVRNLIGMDPDKGVVAVGGPLAAGEWLQFMIRDAQAAADELRELLQHHQRAFHGVAPAGAVLFSCLGRGVAFFGPDGGDARLVRAVLGDVPLAGFFANGELGPVHAQTRLHGYTASLALFRPRSWA